MSESLYFRVDEIRGMCKTWSKSYIHKLANKERWRRIKVGRHVHYRAEDVLAYMKRVLK